MIDFYTYIIYLLLLKFLSPHSRIVRFFYLEQILYIDPRTISENLKGLEDGVEWDGFVIDWLPSSRSALISFGESIRFLRIIIFQPRAENDKFNVLIWNKIDLIKYIILLLLFWPSMMLTNCLFHRNPFALRIFCILLDNMDSASIEAQLMKWWTIHSVWWLMQQLNTKFHHNCT